MDTGCEVPSSTASTGRPALPPSPTRRCYKHNKLATPHYLLFGLILQSKENQLKLPTPPKKPGVSITNCKTCTPAGRLTPGTSMVCQICQSPVVNKVMGPLKL